MFRTRRPFVLSCVVVAGMIALVAQCTKQGPTGPAGPALSGTLSGFITLINENGQQPADRSGVSVTVDGSSLTATTDTAGMWAIPNLMTGIYSLTYTKTGYGMAKSQQVQFLGGGNRNIGDVNMCQPPSFVVDSLWTRMPKGGDSNSVYIGVQVSTNADGPYRIAFFFGNTPDVSWMPASYRTVSIENVLLKQGLDTASIRLQPINLATDGFAFESGDTVYAAAYPATAGTNNSAYTDLTTGRTVYTDIDTASVKVIQIVVP
jgi:Carboxypeptidase regulatory-like domain